MAIMLTILLILVCVAVVLANGDEEEEPFFNRIRRERPEAFLREVHELYKEEILDRDAEIEKLRRALEFYTRLRDWACDERCWCAQPRATEIARQALKAGGAER